MVYQPGHGKFAVSDPAALLVELCRDVPATLVTHTAEGFRATILPMLFDPDDGPYGTLRGHWARGNPQWRDVGETTHGLAMFDGPDAYVSPAWYPEKRVSGKVVPTWNYEVLNVYGRLLVHDDPDWVLDLVTELTNQHEAGRSEPWQVTDAPESYTQSQLRGIVGVEVDIAKVEGKSKMSQNQPDRNRAGVVAGLRESDAPRDQLVADRVAALDDGSTKANGRR